MSNGKESTTKLAFGTVRQWGWIFWCGGIMWWALLFGAFHRAESFGFSWVLLDPQSYLSMGWIFHSVLDGIAFFCLSCGVMILTKTWRIRIAMMLLGFLVATLVPEGYYGIQDLRFRKQVRADLESFHSEDRWWPNLWGSTLYYHPGQRIFVMD